jgi:hypothetical protein
LGFPWAFPEPEPGNRAIVVRAYWAAVGTASILFRLDVRQDEVFHDVGWARFSEERLPTETNMPPEEFAELRQRLDTLIALAVCQLEHRTESAEVIAVLSRFGIQPREIAVILGMTPNAVRVARHRLTSTAKKPRTRARERRPREVL